MLVPRWQSPSTQHLLPPATRRTPFVVGCSRLHRRPRMLTWQLLGFWDALRFALVGAGVFPSSAGASSRSCQHLRSAYRAMSAGRAQMCMRNKASVQPCRLGRLLWFIRCPKVRLIARGQCVSPIARSAHAHAAHASAHVCLALKLLLCTLAEHTCQVSGASA